MEIEVSWEWLIVDSGLVGDETMIQIYDSAGHGVARGHWFEDSLLLHRDRIVGFKVNCLVDYIEVTVL